MKILYFIRDLKTIGGIERVTVNKANWLVSHGYKVTIVTTDQANEPINYNISENVSVVDLDINYIKSRQKNFIYKITRLPFLFVKHRRKLAKIIKEESPDIIISTFGPEMGYVTNIKTAAPKILEFHSAIVQFQKMKLLKGVRGMINWINYPLIYKKISRFDKFVILNKSEECEWGVQNICSIPNPCSPIYKNLNNIRQKIVVAAGRLSVEKDYITMIDVWKIVSQKVPDWTLNIYGDGPALNAIKQQIENERLSDRVKLMGVSDSIIEVFNKASIFIMTSIYEGQPMSLIEAQSCGLPAIVMETDGRMGDIIDNNNTGYVIPNRNKELMAEKLVQLIKNSASREGMSQKAVCIKDKFSESTIMNNWLKLFQSLLSDNQVTNAK